MNNLAYAVIAIWFLRLIYTDYRLHKIYNRDLLLGLPIALGILIYGCPVPLIALAAASISSLFMLVYHVIAWKKGYAGGGDVKMMTLLPLIFNPLSSWFAPGMFLYVVLLGIVIGFVMILKTKPKGQSIWESGVPLAVPIGIAAIGLLIIQVG